jgi:ubiquinone/menaquinone biosynthesis C-methylase UbiE
MRVMFRRLAGAFRFLVDGLRADSTRDFYDRAADVYDAVCKDQEKGARSLLAYAPPGAETGLDIACGTGAATAALGEKCRRVIGIDFSSAMLAKARGRLPDARYAFLQADFLRLPLQTAGLEQGIDLAVCVGGIRHIPEGLEARFLEGIHRVLAPNGTLLLAVHTPSLFRRAYAVCYNAYMRKRGLDERIPAWLPEQAARLLQEAGFEPRIEQPRELTQSLGCYAAIGRKIFSPT